MADSTCSVDGCESPVRCKEFCNKHYIRFRKHGDPLFRFKPEGKQICTVDMCSSNVRTKGLCQMHAARLQRRGSTDDLVRSSRSCDVDGCAEKHYAFSLCFRHYQRKRDGRPMRLPRDVISGNRMCSRCLKEQPLEEFGISAKIVGGRNIYCSSCLSDMGHIRRATKRANGYEPVSRNVVLERDGWQCHLCGGDIPKDKQWPHPLSASMDHVQPIVLGGPHTYENVKSSHLTCNISKGARIPA